MSFEWPNHPLYDQLCEKASIKLLSLGFRPYPGILFRRYRVQDGRTSFISKDKMLISIQHGGYDMPQVRVGIKSDHSICSSWGPLEYYLDKNAPIYKKHLKLKSSYDFEYDYDLIKNYYSQILEIIKSPEDYLEWQNNVDIQEIFRILKE